MSALGAALALTTVMVAAGHDEASSTPFEALRRLQTGDPAGAATILESVTKREPGNAAAWRALGGAAQRVKDWPRAMEAYLKALAIEPAVVSPMFNVAVAHAAMGHRDEAFASYDCRIPGDTFGFDAVGLGDIDGDGTLDFLITSAWSGIRGFHSGRVFVISSGIRVS